MEVEGLLMDVKLSRQFRDVLNSLPPRERFKMQNDFALSDKPVQFATMMVQLHKGKRNA